MSTRKASSIDCPRACVRAYFADICGQNSHASGVRSYLKRGTHHAGTDAGGDGRSAPALLLLCYASWLPHFGGESHPVTGTVSVCFFAPPRYAPDEMR